MEQALALFWIYFHGKILVLQRTAATASVWGDGSEWWRSVVRLFFVLVSDARKESPPAENRCAIVPGSLAVGRLEKT